MRIKNTQAPEYKLRLLPKRWLLALFACIAITSASYGQSGSCGENLTWVLSDATLIISGTGKMKNYSLGAFIFSATPWDSYLYQIKKVVITNGVTSVGGGAFRDCSNLTSLTIPSSVTSIGSGAFYRCSNLTSLSIPASVTSIGEIAFYYCSRLTKIEVDNANPNYSSDAAGVLFNKGKTELICCPAGKTGEYSIPSSVTSIEDRAFSYCDNLTSIMLPASVTSIGSYAFLGCRSLTKIEVDNANPNYLSDAAGVLFNKGKTELIRCPAKKTGEYTIPSSVTSIGNHAFYYCSSLTSVTIPPSVTSIGIYAFSECRSLTSVTIPSSVTSIEYQAFYYCSSLTSVTIPSSVTSIGSYAFSYCRSLTSITIPSSVTSIESYAFSSCSSLTTVNFNAVNCTTMEMSSFPVFSGCNKLTTVNIGDSVETLPANAFNGCTALETISLPLTPAKHLKNLGELFRAESSNKAISGYTQTYANEGSYYYIPSSLQEIIITKGAETSDAFFRNISVPITVSPACEVIPAGMLSSADSLRELSLPYIGTSAGATGENALLGLLFGVTDAPTGITQYYERGKSKKYAIPASLKKLTITLPASQIGYGALYGCGMLEELVIGSGVQGIGENALHGCYGLKDIYSHWAYPPAAYANSTFSGVNKFACTLHVPVGGKQYYSAADGWKEFFIIQEEAPLVISATAVPLYGGIISGTGHYAYGDEPSLAAIGNWGYSFKCWMENKTLLSNDNTYLFAATASRTLQAVFEARENENTVQVAPQATSATIGWDAVEDAADYLLEIYADAARTQLMESIRFNAGGNTAQGAAKAPAQDNLSYNVDNLSMQSAYYYRLTSYNAGNEALTISVGNFITSILTGTDNPSADGSISLYPNPPRDVLHIRSATPVKAVSIYNTAGKVVATESSCNGSISVATLPSGVYIVKIQTENGVVVRKMTKE